MCSTHMKRFETEVINAPCHITTIEERNWARKLIVSLIYIAWPYHFKAKHYFSSVHFVLLRKYIYFHNFTLCGIVIFQDYAVVHLFVLF